MDSESMRTRAGSRRGFTFHNLDFRYRTARGELEGCLVQIKLASRDLTLHELRATFADLSSLLMLSLGDAAYYLGAVVDNTDESEQNPRRLANRIAMERTDLNHLVDVKKISLNSPLEFIVWLPVVAGGLAMLLKLIDVRNQWNDSRVKRSDSDLRIAQNSEAIYKHTLNHEIYKILTAEVAEIAPERLNELPRQTQHLLNSAVNLLEQIDTLEVKESKTKNRKQK